MQRATVLVAVLFLAAVAPAAGGVAGAAGSATTASDVAAAQSTSELVRTTTLRLTPDDSGAVAAVVEYDTPSNLASLDVRAGTGTVVSTDGFTETENGLQWDNETATPSFTLSVEVNQTISGSRALPEDVHATPDADAAQESGGYSFVDVGEWAILPVPQFSSQWTSYGSVTLSSSVAVAGEGAVGGNIAYLGPERTYTASENGQEFRLVVPAAASLAESPDDILASLTSASDSLQVGARDERVMTIAAPTSVDWGPAGLEYGGSDSWVLADSRLDTAGNVWLHEYVHTRQDFSTTSATQWVTEATAEYYGALLTLQQGRIGFDAFAEHLQRGTRSPYASAVLADPGTWTYNYANYVKGPLVYGNVDRVIRLASDGEHTAEDVLGRLNVDTDGTVTQSEFLAAIAAAGSDDVASYARRYTETRAVPDMWGREAHAEAFESATARLVASVPSDGVRVTGPYRNTTTGSVPTLVTGETTAVSVDVTNEGGADGSFTAALLRSGRALDTTDLSVAPGETATATVSATFDEAGQYTLTYGYETRTIRVREPASPNATVEVDATTVAPGDAVRVSLEASNPADYPANGTYPVVVDGETVETWTAALGPAETASFETTVTLDEPGAHTVRVGDRTFTVTVEETATTAAPSSTGSTPGFGVTATVVSALLAALVASRRR
ncbi:CARDB domain-containing protein [Salarchaeum sp. III]|uniref:CARDB domain-containing protein n=1 Tax=Salarchaeum sp. III TaxID=3107927 RepID=UPI002EDAA40B